MLQIYPRIKGFCSSLELYNEMLTENVLKLGQTTKILIHLTQIQELLSFISFIFMTLKQIEKY